MVVGKRTEWVFSLSRRKRQNEKKKSWAEKIMRAGAEGARHFISSNFVAVVSLLDLTIVLSDVRQQDATWRVWGNAYSIVGLNSHRRAASFVVQ